MTKIAVDTGEVYGATEAARLIGISYATIYRWVKAKKLIVVKLAGRTLVPKSEVERIKAERAPLGKEELSSDKAEVKHEGQLLL